MLRSIGTTSSELRRCEMCTLKIVTIISEHAPSHMYLLPGTQTGVLPPGSAPPPLTPPRARLPSDLVAHHLKLVPCKHREGCRESRSSSCDSIPSRPALPSP
eukprot:762412-Hanusia_phi.AAC.1